uniref:Uncharacterized protein n=1 Tax=Anguilla anguilla TaxID=7936 RepID=A0A0E9Q378_ANGAN
MVRKHKYSIGALGCGKIILILVCSDKHYTEEASPKSTDHRYRLTSS